MVRKYKKKTRTSTKARRTRRRRPLRGGSIKSAMVIVEPRNNPKLKAILENAHNSIPPEWDLYVFHGESPETAKAAKDAVSNIEQNRTVILKSIGVDNMSAEDYNRKLTDKRFWNEVAAENILVFQTDSILCGKRNINDFIKYDYIGCAINDKIGVNSPWENNKPFYGVGGLSFRHKSSMLNCIDKHYMKGSPEDVLFSKCVHESPPERRPESSEVLHLFCTQRGLPKNNEPSFAAHKISELDQGDRAPLFDFCPDAKLLST